LSDKEWRTHNPSGSKRVVVTKELPGDRWLEILAQADRFMCEGHYKGWLPTLFLGEFFWHKTVGVIGAGRIGATYARMMVEGHKMNLSTTISTRTRPWRTIYPPTGSS